MGPVRFTRHALQRMSERGIDRDDVIAILENPAEVEQDPLDPARRRAFGRMKQLPHRLIRVVYIEGGAERRVISVMPDRNRGRRAP